MDFNTKLSIVLDELSRVYGLTPAQTKIIGTNIIKRFQMYKGISFSLKGNETLVLKHIDSVGDFFLNRLIVNIRDYALETTFNSNITEKGTYIAAYQQLNLESYKSIYEATKKSLLKRNPNTSEEMIRKATLKVFNHELGHAFQTAMSGTNGIKDSRFNQLLSSLSIKYPEEFRSKKELPLTDLETIQRGMKPRLPKSKNEKSSKMRTYYASNALTTHLDEIFNEDEALKVTGVETPEFTHSLGNGISRSVYNYESSNYRITPYAALMKTLLGEERTFESMYIDSIVAYDFFDQFMPISNVVFKDPDGKYPPMAHVLSSFDKIKNNGSLEEALKLDSFFTTLLVRKTQNALLNPGITLKDIEALIESIKVFKRNITVSENHTLPHERQILEIQRLINKKREELRRKANEDFGKKQQIQQEIDTQQRLADSNKKGKEGHPGVRRI